MLDVKHEAAATRCFGDCAALVVEDLFISALNSRLWKVAMRSAAPPFTSCSVSVSALVQRCNSFALSVEALAGAEERAIAGALEEVERVKRHGFAPAEIEIAVADLESRLRSQYLERQQEESADIAADYVEHFLSGGRAACPDVEARVALTRQFVRQRSAQEGGGKGDGNALARDVAEVARRRLDWSRDCVAQLQVPEAPPPSRTARVWGALTSSSGPFSYLSSSLPSSSSAKTAAATAQLRPAQIEAIFARVAAADDSDIAPWAEEGGWRSTLLPAEGLPAPGRVVTRTVYGSTCTGGGGGGGGGGCHCGDSKGGGDGEGGEGGEGGGRAAVPDSAGEDGASSATGSNSSSSSSSSSSSGGGGDGTVEAGGAAGDSLGAEEFVLSNGMVVCLKQTAFLEDELLLLGFARGGLTQMLAGQDGGGGGGGAGCGVLPATAAAMTPEQREHLLPSAKMAAQIAEEMGVCGVPPGLLRDLCAGKRAEIATQIQRYRRVVSGEASRQVFFSRTSTDARLTPYSFPSHVPFVLQR